ncbi:MAG: ABC transporter permease [Phycisphaerales bacterium]|nr:ABC transporter permease [Phycisphaerales bacterium]
MLPYISRRLLFMIPTLIGMTLMVYTLIALAPGGFSASASAAAGGGSPAGGDPRIAEAKFRDRFLLDEPVLVQYGRWLARVFPIKFGERAQIDATGERIYPPAALPETMMVGSWGGDDPGRAVRVACDMTRSAFVAAAEGPERQAQYRALSREAKAGREAFVGALTQLRIALAEYATATKQGALVDRRGELQAPQLDHLVVDESASTWAAVRMAADTATATYARAAGARAALEASFESRPFTQAGIGILPGILSVGAPDLGWSRTKNRPVGSLIMEALPVTLLINVVAFPLIYLVSIPTGMLAAARRGSLFDVISGGVFIALWSIPVVWAGVLAVGFLASNQYLGLFPVAGLHSAESSSMAFLPGWGPSGFSRGWLLDLGWHLVLPVVCLVYAGFAVLSRQTRAAMLDNLNADYVRTAKAKGVPRHDIILRHVFRNSLLPLITMFVSIFPAMLAGSVIVEKIFSVPGMGSLMLEAISLHDAEIMLANTVMIGCVSLMALLLADILYALADPRVSYA